MSRAILELAPTPRADLSCRRELRMLHEHCFGSLERSEAASVLFALGYTEGRVDALQVLGGFLGERPPEARFSGPGLSLLMQPDDMAQHAPFRGSLQASVEAELHVESLGIRPWTDSPKFRYLRVTLENVSGRRVPARPL